MGIAPFALGVSEAALAQNHHSVAELSGPPGWVQVPGMLVRPDCVQQESVRKSGIYPCR